LRIDTAAGRRDRRGSVTSGRSGLRQGERLESDMGHGARKLASGAMRALGSRGGCVHLRCHAAPPDVTLTRRRGATLRRDRLPMRTFDKDESWRGNDTAVPPAAPLATEDET
jgi:hypothetical protein